MTSPYSPETMRARFAELTDKRDRIMAKTVPMRRDRDAMVAAHTKELQKTDNAIRKAEAGLFEINQELSTLTKALGGKTAPIEAPAEG